MLHMYRHVGISNADPPLRLNTRCFMAKFDYPKYKPEVRPCLDRKSCIRHQTSCNVPGPSLCKYKHVHVNILGFTIVGKINRVLEKNGSDTSDKNHFIYFSVSFAELSFYLVLRVSTCIFVIGMFNLISLDLFIPRLLNLSRIYFFDIQVLVICPLLHPSSLSPYLILHFTGYSFTLLQPLSGFFSVVNAHAGLSIS